MSMRSIIAAGAAAIAAGVSIVGGGFDTPRRNRSRGERVEPTVRHGSREERSDRKRALLDRQARREKSGFYEGTMPVASVLGQRFGRFGRQVSDKTGKLVRLR